MDEIKPPSHWDALDALMRPRNTEKIIRQPRTIQSNIKSYTLPRNSSSGSDRESRKIKIGDLSTIGTQRKATPRIKGKVADLKIPDRVTVKSNSALHFSHSPKLFDAKEIGVKSNSFHDFQNGFQPNNLFYMSSKPKPAHVDKKELEVITRSTTTDSKFGLQIHGVPNHDNRPFGLPTKINRISVLPQEKLLGEITPGQSKITPSKSTNNDETLIKNKNKGSSIMNSKIEVKFIEENTNRTPARQHHFERLQMRRRSNSDPSIKSCLNFEKGPIETAKLTRSRHDGFSQNGKGILGDSEPESIKSASFTSAGRVITQEFVFSDQTKQLKRHGVQLYVHSNEENNNKFNLNYLDKISRPTHQLSQVTKYEGKSETQIDIASNLTALNKISNQLKPIKERRSISEPSSPTFKRKGDKVRSTKKDMKSYKERNNFYPSPIIGHRKELNESTITINGNSGLITTKQKYDPVHGANKNSRGSFEHVKVPDEIRRRSEVVKNQANLPYKNGIKDSSDLTPRNHESLRPVSRRAAVVATLPDSDLSDLSDTIANLQRNQPFGYSSVDLKRSKWNFPKLNFKGKDKERMKLDDVLTNWKYKDRDHTLSNRLQELKDIKKRENRNLPKDEFAISLNHFNNFISQFPNSHHTVPSRVNESRNDFVKANVFEDTRKHKRIEAVWELFDSERTYLIDHLILLQEVFLEPLQELQCDGFLLSVDARSVFGNVEELCEVNMKFCHDLLNVVKGNDENVYGNTNSILAAFKTFDSAICPPYQRYCTTYENFMHYREELKSNIEFTTFIKWCERNERCQRLQLIDFLVSPIQHITKYPLLLDHIVRYTDDQDQIRSIEGTLGIVKESLKALEGKVTWLTKFQLLQDLQSSVIWPSVCEIDTKTVLPENLRQTLSQQPCDKMLANPSRDLIFEGSLTLVENGRYIDIYALLFDDMIMFTTKLKKGKRRTTEVPSSLKRHEIFKDGSMLVVHRQPIALDRFMIYDVDIEQANQMGLKHAFVMVQENRFQQMTSISMIQASSEEIKRLWLSHLASTAAQWIENL